MVKLTYKMGDHWLDEKVSVRGKNWTMQEVDSGERQPVNGHETALSGDLFALDLARCLLFSISL